MPVWYTFGRKMEGECRSSFIASVLLKEAMEMKPGDKITAIEKYVFLGSSRENRRSGSVGCFVSSWDLQRAAQQDFFTVALHVAVEEEYDGPDTTRQIVTASETVKGNIFAQTPPLLDTCLVLVARNAVDPDANSLGSVNGRPLKITDVWDPTETLKRLDDAQSSDEQDAIKRETLAVSHLGGTLASEGRAQIGVFDGIIQCGFIDRETRRVQMKGRKTYAGDSGGPVFDQNGVLVGFIRRGGAKGASTDTEVVLAHYVFQEFTRTLGRVFTLMG